MKYLILALLALAFTACGKDNCDPTGTFGCEQYTSHIDIEIKNDSAEARDFDFSPCTCCSKGRDSWQVPAGATMTRTIEIVNEGGGDGCDESAEYSHLGFFVADYGRARMEFLAQDLHGVCDAKTCKFPGLDKDKTKR